MALNRILIVVYVLISACAVFAWEDKPTDDISEYSWLTDEDFEGAKHLKGVEQNIDWSDMLNPNMFQGDIAGLTKEKLLEMDRALAASLHPRRSIFKSFQRGAGLWPDGKIPYVIHKSYNEHERQKIAAAMLEYHEKTCIRFVQAELGGNHEPKDYIIIKPMKKLICYVETLGNSGGPQLVNLGKNHCSKGTVIHEFLHKLGFIHEHSRPDRDEYITILSENIKDTKIAQGQFMKYPLKVINNLNTSYDYGSIMHYRTHSFSKNGKETIVTKKPGVRIGQREGLSPVDVTRVNRLYKCHNKRPTTTTSPSPIVSSSPTTILPTPTEGSCEVEVYTKKHLLNNGCWASYTTNPRRIRIVSCENGNVIQIDNIISIIAFLRSRETLCGTRQCKNKQFCICCKP